MSATFSADIHANGTFNSAEVRYLTQKTTHVSEIGALESPPKTMDPHIYDQFAGNMVMYPLVLYHFASNMVMELRLLPCSRADRRSDSQSDGWTDAPPDGQTNRQTDGQSDRWTRKRADS